MIAKPNLPIFSTLTPLVRGENKAVHIGSAEGPQLLERYDAGPSWDGLTPLNLDGPVSRQEMSSYVFAWADKDKDNSVSRSEVTPLAYNQTSPTGKAANDVLLGAEVVEANGQFFLHTRGTELPEWMNETALPSYAEVMTQDTGWLVPHNPNSARMQQVVYPLSL